MSKVFREHLRKIGSGEHTSEHLSREEAASAMRMMLRQEATPAQIGAFLIAHRIKRPTGEELAGMLDAYDELGPALPAIDADCPVMVLGSPYDGRSRTASLSPLTALILAAAGCPVVLHGGDVMPTKEGVPLVQTWQALGIDWTKLNIDHVWQVLNTVGIGFVYLPNHFPLAQGLVPYRDEIGKRPPLATLELIWSPYRGDTHLVAGYVHPPTETMIRTAFALREFTRFTTVKGLEGSCDLPRDRTAIIGLNDPHSPLPSLSLPLDKRQQTKDEGQIQLPTLHPPLSTFHRLHLHPHDYGVAGKSTPMDTVTDHAHHMQSVLAGIASEWLQSVVWNSGFYLWRSGICSDVASGITHAKDLLAEGAVQSQLERLNAAIASCM